MSIASCEQCGSQVDTDFDDMPVIENGTKAICLSCFEDLPEDKQEAAE